MVYMPDATSAERERKVKRLGLLQLAGILIGLPLLLLLFRPTPVSLAISLALTMLGAWNGFREARSGRLDMAMPQSPSTKPTASRAVFPIIALLGIVVGSLISGQWAGAVAAVVFFFAGVASGIIVSNALPRASDSIINQSTPTSPDMGFFDFGKKPQWADGLPPHIQLTSTQIKKLEAIRAEMGEPHQAFHWHIATHPESTKMLQRAIYQALKAHYPKAGDTFLLARIIWARLMTAMMQGQDLFGLSAKLSPRDEPTAADLQVIVNYMNQRKLLTLEAVADAIVQEEEQLPDVIPTAPQARAAAQRVTDILRQSA